MQHGTAPGHMDQGIHVDWESVRTWAEKILRERKLAEIGLTAATLSILGWAVLAFHKALQNYQVVGTTFF